MGSSTLDFFFSLLRSGLHGEPVPVDAIPANPDWRQIIDSAQKQTVMGIVFEAVSRLPEDKQPPRKIRDEMLALSLNVIRSHALLDSTLARTAEFYKSRDIPCVLLKGQGVARCYPSPNLRQCGDIDLYVGKKNYQQSVELATKELESSKIDATESVKHFHFNIGKVIIELHRISALMHTPIRNGRLQRWTRKELENPERLRVLDFNGAEVNIPSATFDAFFIFYHGWYHFFNSGIGMRQLCDWAMVLHRNKDEIDRKELKRLLKSLGLMKAWQTLGCIVVERLGLPMEEMPFYNPKRSGLADKVMSKILNYGNFGFYDPSRPVLSLKDMPLLQRKMYLLGRLFKSFALTYQIIPLEYTCYISKLAITGSWNTIKQLISGKR